MAEAYPVSGVQVQGDILQFCRFQFEVPWVGYNPQFLLPLSCHHEPALKGLLRNCKTKERPQLSNFLT